MAISPTGMFMMNSQGHSPTDSTAEASDGPATAEIATTVALMPMPRPRRFRGYITRIRVVFTLVIAAAPIPCAAREMTSVVSEPESAQATDETVKRVRPPIYIFLYPIMSPRAENESRVTIMASWYPFTTHIESAADTPSCEAIVGSATLAIEPSRTDTDTPKATATIAHIRRGIGSPSHWVFADRFGSMNK